MLGRYGAAYLREHTLSTAQARVWRAIEACRTPAMGGRPTSSATAAGASSGCSILAATATARSGRSRRHRAGGSDAGLTVLAPAPAEPADRFEGWMAGWPDGRSHPLTKKSLKTTQGLSVGGYKEECMTLFVELELVKPHRFDLWLGQPMGHSALACLRTNCRQHLAPTLLPRRPQTVLKARQVVR